MCRSPCCTVSRHDRTNASSSHQRPNRFVRDASACCSSGVTGSGWRGPGPVVALGQRRPAASRAHRGRRGRRRGPPRRAGASPYRTGAPAPRLGAGCRARRRGHPRRSAGASPVPRRDPAPRGSSRGQRANSSAVSRGSNACTGAQALNQTAPPSTGTREARAHGRKCTSRPRRWRYQAAHPLLGVGVHDAESAAVPPTGRRLQGSCAWAVSSSMAFASLTVEQPLIDTSTSLGAHHAASGAARCALTPPPSRTGRGCHDRLRDICSRRP